MTIGKYELRLNIVAIVVLLIGCPLLFKLGLWQLDRAAERSSAQQEALLARQATPVSIDDARLTSSGLEYVRTTITGVPLWEKQLLLGGQFHNSVEGYSVLVPMTDEQGITLLVNRGWIPGLGRQKPDVAVNSQSGSQDDHVMTITGLAVKDFGAPNVTTRHTHALTVDEGWPLRVGHLDFAELEQHLPTPLVRRVLQPETMLLQYRQVWKPSERGPWVNYGYAAQWFAMAFGLLGMTLWFCTRKRTRAS